MNKAVARDVAPSPVVTTTLKKAGGSLMVTVPAAVRDALQLVEGQKLSVFVEGDRLVLERTIPKAGPYTLDQLLAQCDFDAPYSDEERAWLDRSSVGRERR